MGHVQINQRDVRILQFKMWSHEAEHGEGGNGREGAEINMAEIHGRIVQKGPKRNGLLQRKHITIIIILIIIINAFI